MRRRPPCSSRHGKVLTMLAILLPTLLGIAGLVFDSGFIAADHRATQHIADAAAEAAAMDLILGKPPATARTTANRYITDFNQLTGVTPTINIPPTSGPYAGRSGYVETLIERPYTTRFAHLIGASRQQSFTARSVAGLRDATAGAAIVVLDPDPGPINVLGLPLGLPALPALLAGFEILGLGQVRVDGAVLVNTEWGGEDQHGNRAGEQQGPPWGIACTPLLPLSKLQATDIRVVGGVDRRQNYAKFGGGSSPLEANRLPVPDPLADLPVPSVASDSRNVDATNRGGRTVIGLPLIGPPVRLYPGVYEWIEVLSGKAIFEPGIYIIRGRHPVTQISLNIVAGEVVTSGAMFYITNSGGFNAAGGLPDVGDDPEATPPNTLLTTLPSVLINAGLLGSGLRPLSDPGSPYHGMLIYQRRLDRRPIVLIHEDLLGSGSVGGTIYGKWSHMIFVARGNYDMRIVVGTLRIVTALGAKFEPTELLPPARDVFLVE